MPAAALVDASFRIRVGRLARPALLLAAGAAAALLVVAAIRFDAARDAAFEERRALAAEATLVELVGAYDAAETNQRAYVASREPDYLAAHVRARELVPALLDALERQSPAAQATRARPDGLRRAVERQLLLFRGAVEAPDGSRLDAFSAARRAATRDVHRLAGALRATLRQSAGFAAERRLQAEALGTGAIAAAGLVGVAALLLVQVGERRRGAAALATSEARYHALFDHGPFAAVVHDPATGELLEFNRAAHEMLGYSREEFLREVRVGSLEDPATHAANRQRVLASRGAPLTILSRLRHRDGSWRTLLVSLTTLRRRDRLEAYSLAVDITDREETRARLEAAERTARERLAQLDTLYRTAPVGLSFVDRDGRFVAINDRLAEINGVPRADHVGRSVREVLPPELAAAVESIYARVLATGRPVEDLDISGDTLARPGEARDWVASYHPVREGGRIVGIACTVAELTERRRAEAALQALHGELEQRIERRTGELRAANLQLGRTNADLAEANEQLETFSYSVAHDLRAPLRNMHTLASALLEDHGPALPAEAGAYVDGILESSTRLDAMIANLLDYARVGRAAIAVRPVAVDGVIAAALDATAADAAAAGAVVETAPSGTFAFADAPLLERALANLVGNALKFRREGAVPCVAVRVERQPAAVRIAVVDDGIGIDPRHHERIFEVFERLDAQRYGGTGIGLAIVAKAAARMGGSVGVESAPGAGSRFWIELPLVGAA